jgi:hypothetical protein
MPIGRGCHIWGTPRQGRGIQEGGYGPTERLGPTTMRTRRVVPPV